MMAKTQVWAHRGASGWDVQYAPENTMPAFEKAEQMGADGIELDVQLTKDGEIVICHDERIDRTSDGSGWLKDYTLTELRRFSFSKTHPEYGVVAIPTLEEFFAFLQGNNLIANIELKTGVIYYDGLEEKTVSLARRMGVEQRIIYSSFNHYSLQKLKQIDPDAKIGLLCGENIIDVPEYPKRLCAMAVHPAFRTLANAYIRQCHDHGLAVHTWTVDVKSDMKHLCDVGIDAFITDCPDSGRRVADGDMSWKRIPQEEKSPLP